MEREPHQAGVGQMQPTSGAVVGPDLVDLAQAGERVDEERDNYGQPDGELVAGDSASQGILLWAGTRVTAIDGAMSGL